MRYCHMFWWKTTTKGRSYSGINYQTHAVRRQLLFHSKNRLGERRWRTPAGPLVTANVLISFIFTFLLYLRTVTTLPSKCFCSPEPCSMKVPLLCLKLLQRYLVLNMICTRIKRCITACSDGRQLLARIVLNDFIQVYLCFRNKYNYYKIFWRRKRLLVRGTTCNRTPKFATSIWVSSRNPLTAFIWLVVSTPAAANTRISAFVEVLIPFVWVLH